MRYQEESIRSVSELIDKLKAHIGDYKGPVWFRGQGDATWNLEPKLLRGRNQIPETHYANRFKQDASLILNHRPSSEFEWMFLMQHYGVPTRLLDWSESPLVALYFAVSEALGDNGALWVLLPTELNKISRYRSAYEFEIPSFEDTHLSAYIPSVIAAENKTFLDPMAAIAPRNSQRMQAQKGVFTISHRENVLINRVNERDTDHFWRYIIQPSDKQSLINELRLLGYNKFQLFPELESLAANLF